jgi:hypothetical protein
MGVAERRRLRPGTMLAGARLKAVVTTAARDATAPAMAAAHVPTGALNGRRLSGG